MARKELTPLVLTALIVGSLVGAGAAQLVTDETRTTHPTEPPLNRTNEPAIEAFTGPDDFASYVAGTSGQFSGMMAVGGLGTATVEPAVARESASVDTVQASEGAPVQPSVDTTRRYAGTNVQVAGIDEPDIVKTDGQAVFYSPGSFGQPVPLGAPSAATSEPPKDRPDRPIYVLSAEEPAHPELIGKLEQGGRLLFVGDSVVSIGSGELQGIDVRTPGSPEAAWTRPLEGQVVTARLANGQLYLVTRSRVSQATACPIAPLGEAAAVPCNDIYHPRKPASVDAVYSVFVIDPATGDVEDSIGFVGSASRSVVYMSENGLYVTYQTAANTADLYITFLLETQSDRLDEVTKDRLEELRGYNLSQRAKFIEAQLILNQWLAGLDEEARMTTRNNLRNAFADYLAEHKRDLVSTGIVKVDIDPGENVNGSLDVAAVGRVPGVSLNQFSVDEHEGHLRIATTIPRMGGSESANDLYVLNESLEIVGSVTDMGLDERIYSVRYVGDTAYVVTFRRIDPFHVVDLSDPTDPEVTGELKLPGFSSYLHPLDDDRVLGIGEEDGQVKAVIFDVSDPSSPTIEDSYVLDERWTAIQQTHHAFLLDRKHGVFFLPGSQGGYVMQYEDGLELERTVRTDHRALRARYIGDYLYVFAGQEVVVLDERTWERTETIDLE